MKIDLITREEEEEEILGRTDAEMETEVRTGRRVLNKRVILQSEKSRNITLSESFLTHRVSLTLGKKVENIHHHD